MSDAESQEAKDLARYREGEAQFNQIVKDMNFFDSFENQEKGDEKIVGVDQELALPIQEKK
jgi:hypothetical protein